MKTGEGPVRFLARDTAVHRYRVVVVPPTFASKMAKARMFGKAGAVVNWPLRLAERYHLSGNPGGAAGDVYVAQ